MVFIRLAFFFFFFFWIVPVSEIIFFGSWHLAKTKHNTKKRTIWMASFLHKILAIL